MRNNETRYLTYVLVLLNVLFLLGVGTLLYSGLSETAINVSATVVQVATFAVKLLLVNFVFVWVRWTLPRFRYDQLQTLGWKVLMPLSIVNICITALVVVIKGL